MQCKEWSWFYFIPSMAAFMGRTEVKVRETGHKVTVPNNDIAKLMYYIDCVCSCIEPDDSSTISRLRDYKNYDRLSSDEETQLLALCLALSPEKLTGTIFHPATDCGDFNNKFLELSAVKTNLLVTESLVIGGHRRKILKIMMYEKVWVEKYYINPLSSIERSRRRPPPRQSDDCIIL